MPKNVFLTSDAVINSILRSRNKGKERIFVQLVAAIFENPIQGGKLQ